MHITKPKTGVGEHHRRTRNDNRKRLKLLSYNIQVGISTTRRFDYIAHSWKHFIPHSGRHENLMSIARLIRDFDIVGLQELDGGSFRTNYINQTEFLAKAGGFRYWHDKINRNIGKLAKHSMGVLSKLESSSVSRHCLPGRIAGRGALVVEFGNRPSSLALMLVHLSLGQKARMQQIDYLSELVGQYPHVVLMGDMNCQADSPEMQQLRTRTGLISSGCPIPSYPSWNPTRRIDHILVSPSIAIEETRVLNLAYSDHLPVAMMISLPESFGLDSANDLPGCRTAA